MRRLAVLVSLALPLVLPACNDGKLDNSPPQKASAEPTKPATPSASVEAGGTIEVKVDGQGYHPAEIHAPANAAITLAFVRADEQNCGEELVFAGLGIEKDLPAGERVEVAITTPASGEVGFACGMNMYEGKVVVRP
jgi:plastocyanin domain-containing protein